MEYVFRQPALKLSIMSTQHLNDDGDTLMQGSQQNGEFVFLKYQLYNVENYYKLETAQAEEIAEKINQAFELIQGKL